MDTIELPKITELLNQKPPGDGHGQRERPEFRKHEAGNRPDPVSVNPEAASEPDTKRLVDLMV